LKTNKNYKNSFRSYSHNTWTGRVAYGFEYRNGVYDQGQRFKSSEHHIWTINVNRKSTPQ